MTEPSPSISGKCDEKFAQVRGHFEENFRSRGEIGASLAIFVEGQLVVALATRVAVRAPAAPALVAGQEEGRGVRAVVERAEHHGLVGVAALEHHDDLHPDPGDELVPPRRTGPGLHRPDPARAVSAQLPDVGDVS